ncbi:MAG: hypothetical protein U5L73_16140 [Rhodoferax sp.]|uniref:hypothetical protein n=1 Tax=Rhodoferax sp. TaxID=50421 RepID=UPI002ACD3322|nr:hypothetical protein [Rhodoferax sp.]MDZ7893267.1 hypothetical protein [Rhodoferax sp.]
MRHAFAFAIVFAALTATGTTAQAQKVYKCGNTYSQTPCGDGKTLDTSTPDASTDIARKQTVDKENKRQLAAAKALEKERLATEAEVRKRHALEAKVLEQEKARTAKGAGKDNTKKKEGPQFFTAKPVPPAKP